MKDIQQLIKKDGELGRYLNIYPKTYTDAIIDKLSGQTLHDILLSFNMYFLNYTGNTATTRLKVPPSIRKKGLWITYVKYDNNIYTEYYIGNNTDNTSWLNSSNWRMGNNSLIGDISISSNGNWVINNEETEFKAIGEKGDTPLIRVDNNKLLVSYDLGLTFINVSDNPVYTKYRLYNNKLQVSLDLGGTWSDVSDYIAAWFKWELTSNDIMLNNLGRLKISRNNGSTWESLSGDITNNLYIAKYIGVNESLPTSGIPVGTIYAKGPTYAVDDTNNDNPIYRLWVYSYKGDTLAWQDNGEFLSISAGVVLSLGDSTTQVMSQKAVTDSLGVYNVDINIPLSEGFYTPATARAAVPTAVRKLGLIITYKTDETTTIIEQFTGTSITDWAKNHYWSQLPSIDASRKSYHAIFGESSSKLWGPIHDNIRSNTRTDITVKNNTEETKIFKIGLNDNIGSAHIRSFIYAVWPGSSTSTHIIKLAGGEQFTLKDYIFPDWCVQCFLLNEGVIQEGDITLTIEGINNRIIPNVLKNSEDIAELQNDTRTIFDKLDYIQEENLGIKDSLMVGGNFGTANNFTIPETYIVPVNDFYFTVNDIYKMFTKPYANNQFQSSIFISEAKDLWQAIINAPDKFTRIELLCYCKEKEAQDRIVFTAYNNKQNRQVYLLKEKKSDTVIKATLVIDNSLMVADDVSYLYLTVYVQNLTTYTEAGDFGVTGYKMAIFDTLEDAKNIKIKGDWLNAKAATESYVQNELVLAKYGQFGTIYNNVKRNQDLLGFAISLIKKYENTGLVYLYNRILVSFNGDSIIGSQLGDITKSDGYETGEFPPNMSKNIMARMFFDKYRFSNEDVIFRNLIHSDWIKTGFTVNNGKDDSSQTFNEIEVYGCEEGDSAEITITGKKYIKFIWSEYKGKAYSFNIMMSVNGGVETKLETVTVTADRKLMTAYIIKNLNSNNTYKFRIVPTSGFSDVCFWGIEAWSNLRLDVVVEAFSGSTIDGNKNKLLDGWYSSFHTPALVISDMLVINDASNVLLNNWMNYTGALFSYLNQNGVPALFFIPHNVTYKFLVENGGKFANLYNVAIVDIQSKMKYNAPASSIVNNTDGLHLSNYGNTYYFKEIERIFDNYEV